MKKRKMAKISVAELVAMQHMCVFAGCPEIFKGQDLPRGWCNLLVYSGPGRPDATLFEIASGKCCVRDHVLCPRHSKLFVAPKRLSALPDDLSRAAQSITKS
jgi:hypothetical protein